MPHAVDPQADFRPEMDELVSRLLGEFAEQPGLKLTLAQATRLFAMDTVTCTEVLHTLIGLGALAQTRHGHFVSVARPARQLRSTRA